MSISQTAHIWEPSGVGRENWPVTAGLPFPEGEVRSPEQICLSAADGAPILAAFDVRATWPDGSIKWALADFQVNLRPAERDEYGISSQMPSPATKSGTHGSPLRAASGKGYIDVATGVLETRIGCSGSNLLQRISDRRHEFLAGTEASATLFAVDATSRRFEGQIDGAEIEEQNPLRLVVRAWGRFASRDESLLSWTVRFCFYANQPFVRLYHTFIHAHGERPVELSRLGMALELGIAGPPTVMAGGGPAPDADAWDPEIGTLRNVALPLALYQWAEDEHALVVHASEPPADPDNPGRGELPRAAMPWRQFNSSARGWMHVAEGDAGFTLKLRRARQNNPYAIALDGRRLSLDLWPDDELFPHHSRNPGTLLIRPGMAKTHELFLQAGEACSDALQADRIALSLEQPLLLQLAPDDVAESGALGPLMPLTDVYWPLENRLRDACRPDSHGALTSGAAARHDASERDLTGDLPRSLLRQYLRSGDPGLFWDAEAAVFHALDIATCHNGDRSQWHGGPLPRNVSAWPAVSRENNAPLTPPTPADAALGGLLDYYFLTGYRRAFEGAEVSADFCRRNAPYAWRGGGSAAVANVPVAPAADAVRARAVGRALTAMGQFHHACGGARFLRAMETLVDLLEQRQDEEGRWPQQIGSHQRGARTAESAEVLRGLQLYYLACGDERARRMLIEGARFLCTQARSTVGLLRQFEAPMGGAPDANCAALLEPLAWVFEETGDADVLDVGYRLFRWLIDERLLSPAMLVRCSPSCPCSNACSYSNRTGLST